MTVINGTQRFRFLRPVHHIQMQVPLENIAGQPDNRHREPFPGLHVVKMLSVDPQSGKADRVNDKHMDRTVVPV